MTLYITNKTRMTITADLINYLFIETARIYLNLIKSTKHLLFYIFQLIFYSFRFQSGLPLHFIRLWQGRMEAISIRHTLSILIEPRSTGHIVLGLQKNQISECHLSLDRPHVIDVQLFITVYLLKACWLSCLLRQSSRFDLRPKPT